MATTDVSHAQPLGRGEVRPEARRSPTTSRARFDGIRRKCFILPMVPKLQRSRQRRLQKDLMHQSVVVLFVSVGLMLSCSSTKDGDRVTVKPGVGAKKGDALGVAPEEKRMFEVKSPADLSSLNVEYMKLWNDGFDGTLEVNFAPGTYAGTGWSLEPELSGPSREAAPTIDVVLRGDGAVLGALPGGIRARDRRTLLRRAANWR